MHAIFEPDGDTLVPTALARVRGTRRPCTAARRRPCSCGRWRQATPDGVTMAVARLTVELLRPIPIEPLVVRAEVVRPGRRVQLVDAAIHHAATGAELVRARALRIREASVPLPYEDPVRGPLLVPEPPPRRPRPASRASPARDRRRLPPGRHRAALRGGDVERARARDHVGPAAAPLVAGEEPSPLQRTAALSDMGNGVSGRRRLRHPHVHQPRADDPPVAGRRPASGSPCAAAPTSAAAASAWPTSSLYDADGFFGRAAQSLFVDTR